MDNIIDIFKWIAEVIDIIGVVILLIGFSRGFINYLQVEVNRLKGDQAFIATLQIVRCDIGIYILLALDFMIASDIISSLIHTNLDELLKLGIIVVLRTAIGYFLSKEIAELHGK